MKSKNSDLKIKKSKNLKTYRFSKMGLDSPGIAGLPMNGTITVHQPFCSAAARMHVLSTGK